MRPIVIFASGLAAGVAFLVACGEIPGSGADEPLDTLPAPATRVVEAPCDKERRYQPLPNYPLTTQYYAEIRVEGLMPSDVLSAVGCGRDDHGDTPYTLGCEEPDALCEGYVPPADDCRPVEWRLAPDVIVVDCGRTQTTNRSTGTTYTSATVRLVNR